MKTNMVACMENVQINMGSEVQWDLVLSHSQNFDLVLREGTQKILPGSAQVPVIFNHMVHHPRCVFINYNWIKLTVEHNIYI
jgi:hypothetical protein